MSARSTAPLPISSVSSASPPISSTSGVQRRGWCLLPSSRSPKEDSPDSALCTTTSSSSTLASNPASMASGASCVSSAGTASISPLTSSAFRRANVPSSASSDIDVSTAPSTGAPTCSSCKGLSQSAPTLRLRLADFRRVCFSELRLCLEVEWPLLLVRACHSRSLAKIEALSAARGNSKTHAAELSDASGTVVSSSSRLAPRQLDLSSDTLIPSGFACWYTSFTTCDNSSRPLLSVASIWRVSCSRQASATSRRSRLLSRSLWLEVSVSLCAAREPNQLRHLALLST
mmetsp:Transcript_44832/g.103709  ORF Transcript_44832/g.103709 Transcript_44832/m.103709 type:complete len:288 (-) Transcript_44832:432-1295(-)